LLIGENAFSFLRKVVKEDVDWRSLGRLFQSLRAAGGGEGTVPDSDRARWTDVEDTRSRRPETPSCRQVLSHTYIINQHNSSLKVIKISDIHCSKTTAMFGKDCDDLPQIQQTLNI